MGSEPREPGASGPGPSFRSVFISDLHLGSRRTRVGRLLPFLRGLRCDVLYLVGDIVDSWGPGGTQAWPPAHRDVLEEFRRLVAAGTSVHYLRGNHDGEFGEDWLGKLPEITARRELEHETLDGRRFVVLHGDQFDLMHHKTPWLTRAGDWFAGLLDVACMLLEGFRHPDLRGELALAIKRRLKGAVGYTRTFEKSAAAFARERRLDGVICGHVHHPAVVHLEGVLYHNDGDWVQNCTALVEHADGKLELLRPEGERTSAAA